MHDKLQSEWLRNRSKASLPLRSSRCVPVPDHFLVEQVAAQPHALRCEVSRQRQAACPFDTNLQGRAYRRQRQARVKLHWLGSQ